MAVCKIKSCLVHHLISHRYDLGLPNKEVRSAFLKFLLQNFAPVIQITFSEDCVQALESHNPDCLFKQIGRTFAHFAYQVFVNAKESTYHEMLVSMLYKMGLKPLSEQSTNTGPIDVLLEVSNTTYIIELQLNGPSQLAFEQVYAKQYFKAYMHKGKDIVILGANFSSQERTISDWKGALLSESGQKIKDIFSENSKNCAETLSPCAFLT